MAKQKQLKLTLVKSLIARNKSQKAIITSLGLTKLNQSIILADTPATRGIIQKVGFMLKVEEI